MTNSTYFFQTLLVFVVLFINAKPSFSNATKHHRSLQSLKGSSSPATRSDSTTNSFIEKIFNLDIARAEIDKKFVSILPDSTLGVSILQLSQERFLADYEQRLSLCKSVTSTLAKDYCNEYKYLASSIRISIDINLENRMEDEQRPESIEPYLPSEIIELEESSVQVQGKIQTLIDWALDFEPRYYTLRESVPKHFNEKRAEFAAASEVDLLEHIATMMIRYPNGLVDLANVARQNAISSFYQYQHLQYKAALVSISNQGFFKSTNNVLNPVMPESPKARFKQWQQSVGMTDARAQDLEWKFNSYKDDTERSFDPNTDQILLDIGRTLYKGVLFTPHVYYEAHMTEEHHLPLVILSEEGIAEHLAAIETLLRVFSGKIAYVQSMNIVAASVYSMMNFDIQRSFMSLMMMYQDAGLSYLYQSEFFFIRMEEHFPELLKRILPKYYQKFCSSRKDEKRILCSYTAIGGVRWTLTLFQHNSLNLSFQNRALVLDYLYKHGVVGVLKVFFTILSLIFPTLRTLDYPFEAMELTADRSAMSISSKYVNSALWERLQDMEKHSEFIKSFIE